MRTWLLGLRYWRGRIVYLPPLFSEWRRVGLTIWVTLVAMTFAWWAVLGYRSPSDIFIPVFSIAIGPFLYVRSWRIWDLLVWDAESPWKATVAEQDAGYDLMADAYEAIARRRPEVVREALGKLIDPSPWRQTVATYYAGLADLMEGRWLG